MGTVRQVQTVYSVKNVNETMAEHALNHENAMNFIAD